MTKTTKYGLPFPETDGQTSTFLSYTSKTCLVWEILTFSV